MDPVSVDETILKLCDNVNDRFKKEPDFSIPSSSWANRFVAFNGWPARELGVAVDAYVSWNKADAKDALDWWRANALALRPLDTIARWFLCIPVTSAESERTFSLAGLVATSRRSRLSRPIVNDLVLLHRHLKRERGAVERASALTVAATASHSTVPQPTISEPIDDELQEALLDDGLVVDDEHSHLPRVNGVVIYAILKLSKVKYGYVNWVRWA
jgi:hypothetical protein